jgi:radical SAM-linked protein
MGKLRFRFEKTGRAKYISHLDLMRTFQRAFLRAGIDVKHTEGFNPHPYISIVLPLSLGSESLCEYLDAEINGSAAEAVKGLNSALPEGIRIVTAAEPRMKPGEVGFARYSLELIYDDGKARERTDKIREYLSKGPLIITKKTKRGLGELDIYPHISELELSEGENSVRLTALCSAFEPSINPADLLAALSKSEKLKPDFARYTRLEIYNKNKIIFR